MKKIIAVAVLVSVAACSGAAPKDEGPSLPPFIESVESQKDGSFEVVVGAAFNTPAKGEASSTDFRSLLDKAAMHLCPGPFEISTDNAIGLKQSRHGGPRGTMRGIVACK